MALKYLIKKELVSYFYSPLGFIFIVVFLLVANFLFFNSFFLMNNASVRSYFDSIMLMIVFLTPALTMRSLAEEKKSGTEELLFTLPLTDWQIVIGKYLANLIFMLLVLVLTLTVPVTVSALGNLDWGTVIGGYLGMFMLGALFSALGLYVSSLTQQQISSFLIALFIGLFLFLSGQNIILERLPQFLVPVVQFISPIIHTDNFVKGVIDLRDILYYLSFCFFFLLILTKNLTQRRY